MPGDVNATDEIVLDTNVVVSAMLNPGGAPGSILRAVLDGSFQLLVDNRIAFEYSDGLRLPKLRLDSADVQSFLDFVKHEAEYVTASPVGYRFEDPDDLPFYEVAKGGNAEYLVTGNRQHFPEESINKVWLVERLKAEAAGHPRMGGS
ncbi:MAG: putative toxin-antitoxin system toxin component, PIN family [Spirochaetaceae bacterium]|nr:MAG: putative toxin-antitoxin system toxin component, PIN family [Spirochaetaceae bacterium]